MNTETELVTSPPKIKEKGLKATGEFIRRKFGILSVSIISMVYIFWGMFTMQQSGKTVIQVIAAGVLSWLVGYSISQLLVLQGLLCGADDTQVMEGKQKHIDIAFEANEYADVADDWAERENAAVLKAARTHILMTASMRYSDYFDEDGNYKDSVTITEPAADAPRHLKQRYATMVTALKKAFKVKITPVSMVRLSAESTASLDYNNTGMEPSEYQKVVAKRSAISKLLMGALFGMFTIVPAMNGWAGFYYGLLQVAIYLVNGFIAFYNSYQFMVVTYLNNLKKKVVLLKKLILYGKQRRRELGGGESGISRPDNASGEIL